MNNEKDEKIINKVLGIVNEEYKSHEYLNLGASSTVILLNNAYLIKQNTKLILKAEIEFLNKDTSGMFQKIVYIDPKYEFVVYDFIHGNTMKKVEDVEDTLQKLIDLSKQYTTCTKSDFGYLNEEVSSWSRFLKDEIAYSSLNLKQHIPSKKIVNKCVEVLEKYPFDKKLLHGDFGTHNFIQKDGKLVGVIDPMPVIGDSLYDLLFAVVSNVDLLKNVSLDKLYSLIDEPHEKIDAMFTIVLYCRVSRCLKYHPKDIDVYMDVWNELTKDM